MNTPWYIKRLHLFKDLEADTLRAIERELMVEDYCRGDVLTQTQKPDMIYIVKSGTFEIYHLTEDGQKIILDIMPAGSVFANFSTHEDGSTYIESSSDAVLCMMEREAFFRMIVKHPELTQKLLMMLFARLTVNDDRIKSLASQNIKDRVLHLFSVLASRYGIEKGHTIEITQAFTHEKLAQMIGASRQTVTTVINMLEKEGLLERKGKYYHLSTHPPA